jgi:methylated-DNA-[protein]-cysteine S-methyltransferase
MNGSHDETLDVIAVRRMQIASPVGCLEIVQNGEAITELRWVRPSGGDGNASSDGPLASALLAEAATQLDAYFAGRLHDFDLPLCPAGSEFQCRVYGAMSAIPFGETLTYGQIARNLDSHAQPVGQACGSNPIPIIIPCHRVLAANGIGGYSGAGGVETKIELLKLEQAYPYLL